ncbi:PREDICTED: uncharacterized protein LOC106125814 [Papilio xuthus]|uniref:Uncharacterized protein LOC106125814 n=1 Tax=Papilio xuthus TaxID=66420 RepID=A0AAJ6ZSZ9_PAPXU|nr:PREDICTED: uncharacterized protein LOC106125814 [Papilio xuthus]XP_013178652.1 PREDICTED: uncharacterized protein LOC106125814 [Papilio xuthus]
MAKEMRINDLPLEIFLEILVRTDIGTVVTCRSVCKKWKNIIDENEIIWGKICEIEFEPLTPLIKSRAKGEIEWCHVYLNLAVWSNIKEYEYNIHVLCSMVCSEFEPIIVPDYGVLPVKIYSDVSFYDLATLEVMPIVIKDIECKKISHNDIVTVYLTKNKLYVQKSPDSSNPTEELFEAENFVLCDKQLYFYNNKDVFQCDLTSETITPKLIISRKYVFKEIVYCDNVLYLFTICHKAISITNDNEVTETKINAPVKWLHYLCDVHSVNKYNIISYSHNMHKTNMQTMFSMFASGPQISAVCFYADIIIIGRKSGQILLSRMSQLKDSVREQQFEKIAQLPSRKYAVKICVCERKCGPLIVIFTVRDVILVEYNLLLHEDKPKGMSKEKNDILKRLQRIQERMKSKYAKKLDEEA